MDFPGGSFWTTDRGIPVGRAVRVRVLARDVSLARQPTGQSSIQNVLRGRVDASRTTSIPAWRLCVCRSGILR